MLRLVLTFLLVLTTSPAWAAIVCGNEVSVGNQPLSDPQTLAFTPDAGSNRVAIVAVAFDDIDADNTTASVSSSAGGTWTQYAVVVEEAGSSDLVSYLFYSTDFADGAQTLSVDFSTGITWGMVAAYTCTGVRTSNPWRGAATTGTANGSSTISISVPSAVGDLVIDNVVIKTLGAGESPTEGGGQTNLYNVTSANDNGDMAGSSEPGASGNVTMSWSWSGTSERWSSVGGSLVPARAAGSAIIFP